MPSSRDLAFVGCRLLSLYVLYQAVLKSGFVYLSLVQLYSSNRFGISLDAAFVTVFLEVLVFLFFWFGAGWISRRAVEDDKELVKREEFSPRNVLAIAVAISGIFAIVLTIPTLIRMATIFAIQDVRTLELLISPVATLIVGLLCIVGSKSIADFVVRLRRW